MSISIRMNEKETELIKKFAEINGQSVSEVVRNAIFEKIEDEFDIHLYEQALSEYEKNPVDYSLEDVKKMLDSE